MKRESKRGIPSVDWLVSQLGEEVLIPRRFVVALAREAASSARRGEVPADRASLVDHLRQELGRWSRLRMQPLINATGVVLHTNLGRAPLGTRIMGEVMSVAGGYSNLELDLNSGRRGTRGAYVERCLALLCGAEAATVVNNCAAALVLSIQYLTRQKRQVVVSRGELIQIGGGFRIPEILETTGAELREVGTTNRTIVNDYESAIGPETGVLLKVHRSNFTMSGFVDAADVGELASLAKRKRTPLLHDLGSGAQVATEEFSGLDHEPTPAESIKAGASLVCFSGDKLMGGPQAGILVGKRRLIEGLKKHPFFRAVRCDKMVLMALQACVESYLEAGSEKARDAMPALRTLAADVDGLQSRAERMAKFLKEFDHRVEARVRLVETEVGGGTMPGGKLASVSLDLQPRLDRSVAWLIDALRRQEPAIVGYVHRGWVRLNLRTVDEEEDSVILETLADLFGDDGR